MPRIFLSYRRSDAAGHAGRLYDELASRFGRGNVFLDIDSIDPGATFSSVITTAVRSADVVIVLIGPRWLDRIADANDFVRLELAAALEAGVAVVPVLVAGGQFPTAASLPPDLAPLAARQGLALADTTWRADVERLLAAVEDVAASAAPAPTRDDPHALVEPDVQPDTSHDRAKAVSLVMTDVSFEKAKVDLPALALALAGHVPAATQEEAATEISALTAAGVGHRTKVLMLGLLLEKIVGLRVLTEAIDSLGADIKVDVVPAAPPAPADAAGLEVFYSYAHEDEDLRGELEKHLSILRRQEVIHDWHDRRIGAGKEWAGEIDRRLEQAKIILLLVSADFLASDYCYDIELKRAMQRHEAGDARVIPIILRPVYWKGAPFGKLNALPTDAKAVTQFTNRDEAFTIITEGISEAADELAAVPGAATRR